MSQPQKRMRAEEEEMGGGNPRPIMNEEDMDGVAAQPGMDAVQGGDAEMEMDAPPPPPQPAHPLDTPELVAKILGNLEGRDLNNALNVCERWYAVVDENVGFSVDSSTELVVGEGGGRRAGRYFGLEALSQIGARKVCVEEDGEGARLVHYFNPLHAPKWPKMMWELKVKIGVHPMLFRCLTRDSINLKKLTLDIPILRRIQDEDLVKFKFHGLLSLKITSCPYYRPGFTGEEIAALPKVRTFLDGNTWDSLTVFRMNFPPNNEMETSGAILRFLARHPRLVEVELERIDGLLDLGRFSTFSRLHSLTVRNAEEFVGCDQLPHSISKLCLEGRLLTTDFLHILNGLPDLEELELRMQMAPASLQGPDPYELDEVAIDEFIIRPIKTVKRVSLAGRLMATWSPDFFIHNEDPVNGRIIAPSDNESGGVELFLNERGYYEPAPPRFPFYPY